MHTLNNSKVKKFILKIKDEYRKNGIYGVINNIGKGIIFFVTPIMYYYYRLFKSSQSFVFQGRRYRYFYHRTNVTWYNERAVEIPIIWEIVKKYDGAKVLEIGNVLSRYFEIKHDVLDKYDKVKGIINEDVVSFKPYKKYDLIISISTLEHVGWDEIPNDPAKIVYAIENLKKCLAPGGEVVVTLPLGYNNEMDNLFKRREIKFTKQYYLKRTSADNKWAEVDYQQVKDARYNSPFQSANGLIVGIIENKEI